MGQSYYGLINHENANLSKALCVRLDQSQQGVAPRTCLSTRPVKPRPAGPAGNGPPLPAMRGSGRSLGPPVNYQGSRPGSTTSARSSSAQYNPNARPMSPASTYSSHSRYAPPALGQRSRAGSTSSQMTARSNAPTLWPGPNPPRKDQQPQAGQRQPGPGANRDDLAGRKPVPGQAI
jgi:hypothetical protein